MNTALIVEPRNLERLPLIIQNTQKHLPTWNIVFYCGKNLKTHWEERLSNVEIRELEVNNLEAYQYNDFFRRKELWESLSGEFVLVFQADTWLLSVPPYTIDFYLQKNYSYIGGGMSYFWLELQREGYYGRGCFNGGLSLRKRNDMIQIIEAFPPITSKYQPSKSIYTDPEDVYFVLGCLKLGLPLGEDFHFAIHTVFRDKCFGIHKPAGEALQIIQIYPEILQAYLC